MSIHNIEPNNNEQVLNQNDFIISKTDIKGTVIYCNQIFMEMAQYTESELIGKPHNIIRHPDMPKIAFKLAWDLIKNKEEFFGFVKNLRKGGGFYWVFANITPDYNQNGDIIGYTSVRRKPNKKAIDTISPIYKELLNIEKNSGINKSEEYLQNFLKQNNTSYTELIISLQKGNL